MAYVIYKLGFPQGIHIGGINGIESTEMTLPSDSLYSAIYGEYMKLFGDDKLLDLTEKGEFALSDLLPYKEDQLFVPKPYVSVKREKIEKSQEIDRKKIKSLKFIPVEKLGEYIQFLKTGNHFPEVDHNFGEKQLFTKNMVSVEKDEDTKPYNVEVFRFAPHCGLYFVLQCPEEWVPAFDMVLDSLTLTGIGGKRTSGYGQFELNGDPLFLDQGDYEGIISPSDGVLSQGLYENHTQYLLLSTYLPQENEIPKIKEPRNWYKIIKRSGFVNSPQYSKNPLKRKQLHMITSGSILSFKPTGELVDLNLHGAHSVYRMGKPIVMGVNI